MLRHLQRLLCAIYICACARVCVGHLLAHCMRRNFGVLQCGQQEAMHAAERRMEQRAKNSNGRWCSGAAEQCACSFELETNEQQYSKI